jgi:DNA polymerase III subunit beta
MKFSCRQGDLSRGLSTVSHAVSNRSTLPILSNILLLADRGRVKLAATNLEISITCWIDAQVEEEGAITVPAKLLTDLVSRLPQAPVELAVADSSNTLNIKGQGSNANIKGMAAEEFPLIPGAEGGEPPVLLDAVLLKELIAEVAFAAADDDNRPVLTGVLMQVSDEKITFAAADAFRLAVRSAAFPGDGHRRGDIIIPARSLHELARVLPAEGPVEVVITPNRSQALFHTPSVDMVTRLIEGTFPNYRQIIPDGFTTRAVLATRLFAEAIKRAELFARDSSNILRLRLAPGGNDGLEPGTVTLEATSEDLGDDTDLLAAVVSGPELSIIFNVRYLVDVLAVVDAAEVALELTASTKPGLLRPVSEVAYQYIIMPMHINR